ncbi:MAG: hypothetical protein KDK30_10390 [Leptospiraceae bacterium]|nr:hypothetical protein [Leptospiraceae bacterium]
MQKKHTFGSRFKYRFDNFMSSGPRSIFLTLLLMFLAAYILTALLRVFVDMWLMGASSPDTFWSDLWLSFLQITDPGAMAEDGENNLYQKAVGMVTVFMGLIFFSAVIAFITTQLENKIEDLKKGRSSVVEKNHVLILGWGEMVVEIIRELIEANASEKDAAVVILSEQSKEDMDDFLSERLPDRKSTRIITRTGHISSLESLHRVAVTECKSVIILPEANEAAPQSEKITSDAKALKAILAVVASSREDKTKANIIAEIYDYTKREVMVNLAPDNITMVNTRDIVARIIVQTSRTTGLAVVYSTLIGFDGSEIYFHRANWKNRSFGELTFAFEDGVPIGVRKSNGEIVLNPAVDHVLESDDAIIIIAEDDSSIKCQDRALFQPQPLPLRDMRRTKSKERELIIGWNAKAPIIIREYANYILPGSIIHVILPEGNDTAARSLAELKRANPDINIETIEANPLVSDDLLAIKPFEYDNVILLNQIEEDTEKLDSTTITILLLLREILQSHATKTGEAVRTQLISEVMNSDNLELIARTGVNDSIISYQMISKIMAQVAENPEILSVYQGLFSEEGSEIYLKPLHLYIEQIPARVTVADLMALAQQRNEVMIGYRYNSKANDVRANFGIEVNMPKGTVIQPHPDDRLIVLAEDEL